MSAWKYLKANGIYEPLTKYPNSSQAITPMNFIIVAVVTFIFTPLALTTNKRENWTSIGQLLPDNIRKFSTFAAEIPDH